MTLKPLPRTDQELRVKLGSTIVVKDSSFKMFTPEQLDLVNQVIKHGMHCLFLRINCYLCT